MKHEEIQRKYPNHIFTSYKGIGGSKKLVGDVIAIRFGERTLAVEVLAVQETVGKADAALLYREVQA